MTAATKPAADLGALHDVSRRSTPVSPLVSLLSVTAGAAGATKRESEAEALIAIFADALESIAERTPDERARKIACEALAMLHER